MPVDNLDDFIGEVEKAEIELDSNSENAKIEQEKIQEEYIKRDRLIHQAFEQSLAGKEWLAMVKENFLIKRNVFEFGESHDPYDIGWMAGQQAFIRNIIKTIEKVNKGER